MEYIGYEESNYKTPVIVLRDNKRRYPVYSTNFANIRTVGDTLVIQDK